MIYIASPYTSSDNEVQLLRATQVAKYAAHLLKQEYQVFSPIAYGETMLYFEPDLPTNAKYWESFNFHFLKHCDELRVLMLEGWKESVGISQEIKYAKAVDMPITYVEYPNFNSK